jgi:hypothetical protein
MKTADSRLVTKYCRHVLCLANILSGPEVNSLHTFPSRAMGCFSAVGDLFETYSVRIWYFDNN